MQTNSVSRGEEHPSDYLSSCSSICRRVSFLATYLTGGRSPEREKRGGGGEGRSRWTSIPNLSISARNLCFRRKFTKNSSPLAATCHWSGVNEGKDMWVRDFLEHSDRNILISAGQVWGINFPVFHSSYYIACFHSTCPTWRMTKGFAVVAVIWLLWIVSCHGRKKTEGRMTICFHLLTSGWISLIRWMDEMKRKKRVDVRLPMNSISSIMHATVWLWVNTWRIRRNR